MPLTSGVKLGKYEILALIGKGGMGEVYRAKDTKLGRQVAIKVLPEALARDPDRLARFEREAKVLASLNHSNIATIYGVEEGVEGTALVMELVEGDTLAVPQLLDAALKQARQIAEALEYAHERAVIHRDLKPANIKVTPEGKVKLLDFGLAKAIEDPAEPSDPSNAASNSPTVTLGHTRTGVILGTGAYMSPEQANGKPTDRRSDIFSFGAVFYEMLTGKQAFTGESMGDTLASVLKLEPDWKALPPETPPAIVRLLHRCLAKDRKQRLQAIGEARIVLESPFVEDAAPPKPSRDRREAVFAALALVATALALWGWLRPKPPDTHAVMRFQDTVSMAHFPGAVVLSRDGSRLAFVGGPQGQIYVRMLDQFEARPIPGTEGADFLSFSPDGQSISFMTFASGGTQQLKKISIAGGPAQKLATAGTALGPPVQSWEEDGNIYFASEGVLQRISQNGGQPQAIAAPDNKKGERYYVGPQLLPGGTQLLVSIYVGGSFSSHQVVALNLQTGAKKILLDHAGITQYVAVELGSAMGYLLYWDLTSGSLMAAPFDAKRLEVKGAPVSVTDGISASRLVGWGQFGISDSGTLAYVPGTAPQGPARTLVWVDRHGAEQPISAPPRAYDRPSLSPEGDRVAVGIQYARGGGPGTSIFGSTI
jgi:serine/threonine protein kinase